MEYPVSILKWIPYSSTSQTIAITVILFIIFHIFIVKQLFSRARMTAPSVVFLDELDSIVGGRSSDKTRSLSERILSALLNEMDGIGTSPGERMQISTDDSQVRI